MHIEWDSFKLLFCRSGTVPDRLFGSTPINCVQIGPLFMRGTASRSSDKEVLNSRNGKTAYTPNHHQIKSMAHSTELGDFGC